MILPEPWNETEIALLNAFSLDSRQDSVGVVEGRKGIGIRRVAKTLGVGVSVVQRLEPKRKKASTFAVSGDRHA